MAKRKDSKALFEIIGAGPTRSGQRASEQAPRGKPPAQAQAEADQKPKRPQPLRSAPGVAMVSIADGRLRISLGQPGAAVALAVLLGLLAAAFMLGYATGPGQAGTDSPPQRKGPDQAGDRSGAGGQGTSGPRAGTPPKRKKGLYYLVVQNLVFGREDAENIRQYLAGSRIGDRPVLVTIERVRATTYFRLRDTREFENDRSLEAQQYKKDIKELGRTYHSRGRKYDFRDCWFMPEP